MIATILIRICAAYFLLGSYHDVPLAIFKIYDDGKEVKLAINIDLEDYQASTKSLGDLPKGTSLNAYLDENMQILLDHEITTIKVQDFKMVSDHISITASLSTSARNFSEIEIQNTVLNNIESHSNIIQIELGSEQRDFRMHRGRTNIKLCF